MAPFDRESVSPFNREAVSTPQSLAQLVTSIQSDQSLPPRKRQDFVSSVRSFAKVLDLDLDTAPALLEAHRAKIRAFLPAQARISEKTWSNIRSNVAACMRRFGAPAKRLNLPKDLSPEWLAMRSTLVAHGQKRLILGLSSFIHFCNRAGFQPEDVNDGVASQFLAFRQACNTRRAPEAWARETCRLWNRAADEVPDWPRTKLAIPSYRRRVSLDWAALPIGFVKDLDWWCEAAARQPVGFEDTEARHLSRATINTRREQMRRLASMMLKAGMPESELQSLKDLCRIDRLKAGLTLYAEALGRKEAPSLSETLAGLIALAKNDLEMPAEVIGALKKIKRVTGSRSRTMTERNFDRLRPLRDEQTCARLITLPSVLAATAQRQANPHRRAVAYQTALLIAFLILIPLRLGNLRGLRLDQHLRSVVRHRRRRLFLVIAGKETKNNNRIEVEVPAILRQMIEVYREQHRIHLPNADGHWLFPGARDTARPKSEVMLREQMEKAIAKHVGLRFNPHLARHLAAYLWLREHSGDYGNVARMLGHKNPQTTYQYYAGIEQIEAALRYNEKILRDLPKAER